MAKVTITVEDDPDVSGAVSCKIKFDTSHFPVLEECTQAQLLAMRMVRAAQDLEVETAGRTRGRSRLEHTQ